MTTTKYFTLFFLCTIFLVLACGGDEEGPESMVTNVCFSGDIVETNGNSLDENSRIGIFWNNNDDDDGSLIFFFGEAEIDIPNKTFSICIDSTMLPEKFTLGNEFIPVEEDPRATLGYVIAFESDDFEQGSFTIESEPVLPVTEIGWGIGAVIYKADDFDESIDQDGLIGDFPLGFSLAGCDYDTGEIHDDLIVNSANRIVVYLGSLEEIEAVFGNDPRCNFN